MRNAHENVSARKREDALSSRFYFFKTLPIRCVETVY